MAFKLLHGITIKILNDRLQILNKQNVLESKIYDLESILTRYIDLASLGTVADCMPLIGENRVITTLGLRQMKNSSSAGLKKFIE